MVSEVQSETGTILLSVMNARNLFDSFKWCSQLIPMFLPVLTAIKDVVITQTQLNVSVI